MEDTAEIAGSIALGAWHRLGKRTFWLFFIERLEIAGGFLVLAIAFTIGRSLAAVPAEVRPYLGLAGAFCFAVAAIAAAYSAFTAWIVYRTHEYRLDMDAFKVRQGIMTKREVAIPYRQIQNVDIERTIYDRMLGLSTLTILTAGHEDDEEKEHPESEGILPAMQKDMAEALQDELLKRADVQRVVETK